MTYDKAVHGQCLEHLFGRLRILQTSLLIAVLQTVVPVAEIGGSLQLL